MFSEYRKLHVLNFKRYKSGKDNSQLNTNNQKGIKISAQIIAAILILSDNLSLITIYCINIMSCIIYAIVSYAFLKNLPYIHIWSKKFA